MPSTIELDAVTLKALAHPVRVRMLRYLQRHGPASVTSLAGQLGESTGATSYHLRQLAELGIVAETEPPADHDDNRVGRKQRFWQMAVDDLHVTGFGFVEDDDTHDAATFLLRESVSAQARRVNHWYETATSWPKSWQRASSSREAILELDAKQTRALADDLIAVLDRYHAMTPGRGAKQVEAHYAVFPLDPDQE
jgi:DNA-binding transcriptional ArsR family regulator